MTTGGAFRSLRIYILLLALYSTMYSALAWRVKVLFANFETNKFLIVQFRKIVEFGSA